MEVRNCVQNCIAGRWCNSDLNLGSLYPELAFIVTRPYCFVEVQGVVPVGFLGHLRSCKENTMLIT